MTLGQGQKVKISLTCQFQRFLYQTLCVSSQIKDRKHIEQNFHSVAKVMPRDGTVGCNFHSVAKAMPREGTVGCWGSQKL